MMLYIAESIRMDKLKDQKYKWHFEKTKSYIYLPSLLLKAALHNEISYIAGYLFPYFLL